MFYDLPLWHLELYLYSALYSITVINHDRHVFAIVITNQKLNPYFMSVYLFREKCNDKWFRHDCIQLFALQKNNINLSKLSKNRDKVIFPTFLLCFYITTFHMLIYMKTNFPLTLPPKRVHLSQAKVITYWHSTARQANTQTVQLKKALLEHWVFD